MPDFKSIKDLGEYFNNHILTDVMEDEVAEMVKEEEANAIDELVYDAYTPNSDSSAERRGSYGGLKDTRNMIHTVTNTMGEIELLVRNITEGNEDVDYTEGTSPPNYLTGIIVYGRPTQAGLYINGNAHAYTKPRDFLSETMNEIQRTLKHVDAIKKGLKRNGINTD
ncbi:hypothetical protein [Paraliobacillus ryukyuensis]|uniref:hypothetical protein n=1 Tax=Paraliobacillus ryukyuensis TaxID=200904 RepID=UPI0009A798D7|nr:hypothetical protein [Paraliobacillus ryukyuensis]